MSAHLDLWAGGALFTGSVAIVLLLALQELTEMFLEQEGGVEFPHRHLIICTQASHRAVSVQNTGSFSKGKITLSIKIDSPPIGGMTWSNSFILVRFQMDFIMALSSSLACSKLPAQKNP